MSVADCLSTVYQGSDLFMMVQTVDGVTSCWSATVVDMGLLSLEFPSAPGEFEVMDISLMKIGSSQTVTLGGGFAVKSTMIKNGYYLFDVTVPGEINPLNGFDGRTCRC